MSDKYRIYDNASAYFITITKAGWVYSGHWAWISSAELPSSVANPCFRARFYE